MNITLALYFYAATQTNHLPPGLIDSLCLVESSYNVEAIHHDDGGSDSLGVCQIKLRTAKWLGFKGTAKQLMQPDINIKYAAKYLKYQLARYRVLSRAITAYNRGNSKGIMNSKYSDKVLEAWHKISVVKVCSID